MWTNINPPHEQSIVAVKTLQHNKYNLIVNKPHQFVGYPVIVAIISVLQVLTILLGSRGFLFFGLTISAGWLILMPITLYLFQIVAECYGWQYARQIIWLSFIVNAIITFILFVFTYLPITNCNSQTNCNSYTILLHDSLISASAMLLTMFIADYITATIMCWSKFHCKGKMLLLRVLILHLIAEIIINSGGLIVELLHGHRFHQSLLNALDSFYARSIAMLILFPIVRVIIWWLQHQVEKVIIFDLNPKFAPFKFKINHHESVQFITQEWQMLPVIEQSNLDIMQLVQDYCSNQANITLKVY